MLLKFSCVPSLAQERLRAGRREFLMSFETLGRLLALVAIVAAGPMTVILPSTSFESRSKPKSLLKRFLGHPPIDRHRSDRLRRCLDRFDQFREVVFDHPSLVKGIDWQNLDPLIRGLHPRTAEPYRRFVFFFVEPLTGDGPPEEDLGEEVPF